VVGQFSGDRERPSCCDAVGVTVLVVCVNGTTSNMSAHEAGLLAWRQGALLVAPVRFTGCRGMQIMEGERRSIGSLFVDTRHLRRVSGAARRLSRLWVRCTSASFAGWLP
jgi:hypothetical protein